LNFFNGGKKMKRIFSFLWLLPFLLFAEDNGGLIQTTQKEFAKGELSGVRVTKMDDGEVILSSPSILGSITQAGKLPADLSSLCAVIYDEYLYVIGGYGKDQTGVSAVQYAKIDADGNIGEFKQAPPIPADLYEHQALIWNKTIYVIGGSIIYEEEGQKVDHLRDKVFYTKIKDDGSLEEWEDAPSLPIKLYKHQATIVDGVIYVIGGREPQDKTTSPTKKIFYSLLSPGGMISSWKDMEEVINGEALPIAVSSHGLCSFGNRIYIVGGEGNNRVFSAEPDEIGMIKKGDWREEEGLPYTSLSDSSVVACDGMIIVIGGREEQGTSTILYSRLKADGSLSQWIRSEPLLEERYNHSVCLWKDTIYIIGGSKEGTINNNNIWKIKVIGLNK